MKVAPVHRAFAMDPSIEHVIIDCGFLEKSYAQGSYDDLGLPDPVLRLNEPQHDGASHLDELTGSLQDALITLGVQHLLVYGDVEVSFAAAMAARWLHIPFTHVEAGLRSHDYGDGEEHHRILIDDLAKFHVAHSPAAVAALAFEGHDRSSILLTGSPQIESLRRHRADASSAAFDMLGLAPSSYCLSTVHRRETLADPARFRPIVEALKQLSEFIPVVVLNYRSTSSSLADTFSDTAGVQTTPTLRYSEYLGLLDSARIVVTDSSGIQDETSALGIPCVTCRTTTHRADTVDFGTNRLAGLDTDRILSLALEALDRPRRPLRAPASWSLPAGEQIVEFLGSRLLAMAEC